MISEKTWALRLKIIEKYGGRCTCASCGCTESNPRRLQLDHVKNNGGEERKTVRGERYYVRLLQGPRDPTLQLLCTGCHFEKSFFGECLNVPSSRDNTGVSGVTAVARRREVREHSHQRGVTPEPHGVLGPPWMDPLQWKAWMAFKLQWDAHERGGPLHVG